MTTSTGLVQGREHPKLFTKSGTDPLTTFLSECFGSVKSIIVTIPSKISISWPLDSQHYIFWTEKGLGEGNVKISYFRTSSGTPR